MFLNLTLVYLEPKKGGKTKEFVSVVEKQRVNMNTVYCYYEANDEQKNNVSEQARFNTIVDYGPAAKVFYQCKETVEQIDEALVNPNSPLRIEVAVDKPKEDVFYKVELEPLKPSEEKASDWSEWK